MFVSTKRWLTKKYLLRVGYSLACILYVTSLLLPAMRECGTSIHLPYPNTCVDIAPMHPGIVLLLMGVYGTLLAPFYIPFKLQQGIHTAGDLLSNLAYLSWLANIGFIITLLCFICKRRPPVELTIASLALASLSGPIFGYADFNSERLLQAGGAGHATWYAAMLIAALTSMIDRYAKSTPN